MTYVDIAVAAVPNANKAAYLEHAGQTAILLKRHGALGVVECWGDDVPGGDVTSFPMAVKATADETVVVSWITWPDKAVRDAGWESAVPDMEAMGEMPFDGKRLIFGSFDMVQDA